MFLKILYANIYSVEASNVNFILIMNKGIRLATKHLYCNYLALMDTL